MRTRKSITDFKQCQLPEAGRASWRKAKRLSGLGKWVIAAPRFSEHLSFDPVGQRLRLLDCDVLTSHHCSAWPQGCLLHEALHPLTSQLLCQPLPHSSLNNGGVQ